MARVISMGEALIDFVALETGVTLEAAEAFKKAPGGAPANVAAALGRLGLTCAFCGQVGDDAFGRFLAHTLESMGVDTSLMRFSSEARTGLAFVALTPEGVPDFAFFRNPSADITFAPDQLDPHALRQAEVFHFGSITLLEEPVRTTTLKALALAREGGALVSYDPNYRPALCPSEAEAVELMRSVLPQVDLCKVSEEELKLLSQKDDLVSGAAELLETGPAVVLVTKGEKGAAVYTTSGITAAVEAFSVKVVDTTGCGDAFVAGVLYYVLVKQHCRTREALQRIQQQDWIQALTFANAVAALTAEQRGAMSALPSLDAVEAFLRTRESV